MLKLLKMIHIKDTFTNNSLVLLLMKEMYHFIIRQKCTCQLLILEEVIWEIQIPWSNGITCCCSAAAAAAKLLQLGPTLCDPIDGSPSGSPVPGTLQARTLEWVAISFSNAWKWKVKSEREVTQSLSYIYWCVVISSSQLLIFCDIFNIPLFYYVLVWLFYLSVTFIRLLK